MANADNAIGFVPIKHKKGGEIRLTEYTIASSYNTALGKGDPVKLTGTSNNIARCAVGDMPVATIGVFAGCHYVDANGNPVYSDYWPASTATKGTIAAVASVWDDPNIVFRIQCDTLAQADVGTLMDWDAGTPSATTRLSGVELTVSGSDTTAKAVRILCLSDIPDNAVGLYAKADVMFAEHMLGTGAAGAGGV